MLSYALRFYIVIVRRKSLRGFPGRYSDYIIAVPRQKKIEKKKGIKPVQ